MMEDVPLGNNESLGLLVPHSANSVDADDVTPLHRLLLRHKISRN